MEASLKEKLRLSSPGEETFYSDSSRNISVGLGEPLLYYVLLRVNESCYILYKLIQTFRMSKEEEKKGKKKREI